MIYQSWLNKWIKYAQNKFELSEPKIVTIEEFQDLLEKSSNHLLNKRDKALYNRYNGIKSKKWDTNPKQMKTFKSTGTYTAGNKKMISVLNDKTQSTEDLRNSLKNQIVEIDGKLYLVKSIETFATLSYHVGQPIGLLVEEIQTYEKLYDILDKNGFEMPLHYSGKPRTFDQATKILESLNKTGEFKPYSMVEAKTHDNQ